MLGIFFSIFPLVGWGISDYVSSKMSKKIHPATVNLFYMIVAGVPTLIFTSFFGLPEISLRILAEFSAVSVVLSGAFMVMLKGFNTGATGVVAPIANAYAVVTLAVVALFLSADISTSQVIAVIIVVLGISALSYQKDTKLGSDAYKAIGYAVLAMVLFGFGFAGFDIVATQEWYQNAFLFEISGFIVSTAIFLFLVRKDRAGALRKPFKGLIYILGGLAAAFGTIGLFLAFDTAANVVIPATVAAASPLVTVALARRYDKEKLTLRQYFGAMIIVGGIVLLGLSS